MKRLAFALLCFVWVNSAIAQETLDSSDFRYFRQYCFHDSSCTDTLLVAIVVQSGALSSSKPKKIYETEHIVRLDPRVASDSAIVAMFFKSLEVYNSCAGRRTGCAVSPFEASLFFENSHFKKNYTTTVNGHKVVAKNLGLLSIYDFKRKIEEIALSDGQMIIDFGQGTTLYCSQDFHQEYLFPYCLNFISKNHRITPRNIAVPKVDMKQD
jgi:hypothetical protein